MSTRSSYHEFGRRLHKARSFQSSQVTRVSACAQHAQICCACVAYCCRANSNLCGLSVAVITSDQADHSGVLSDACPVLQHIAECQSWWAASGEITTGTEFEACIPCKSAAGSVAAEYASQVAEIPLLSILSAFTWGLECHFKPRMLVLTRFRECHSEWAFRSFSHWRMPHVDLSLSRVDRAIAI